MAYDPTNRYRLNGKEDQTIGSLESKWIKEQIDMTISRGTLSVETINEIKELAKKEINKAEQVWYESNGSINMNTYFKTQHGNGHKQQ